MTNKELTDKEIIKALRCCLGDSEYIECEECPLYCVGANCQSSELHKYALNLINRQRAEIEELKNYVNRCKSGREYWVKCLLEKPNEALKEFAERMRECCVSNSDLSADAYLSVTTDINCVLKEMVGEEE